MQPMVDKLFTVEMEAVVGHAAEFSPTVWVTVSGVWGNEHQHGHQFKAAFLRASLPTTARGMEEDPGFGMFSGIAFRTSDAIAALPGIEPGAMIRLHAGNGTPMRSYTLAAKLAVLGISLSSSRPRVSNDNACFASWFRIMHA